MGIRERLRGRRHHWHQHEEEGWVQPDDSRCPRWEDEPHHHEVDIQVRQEYRGHAEVRERAEEERSRMLLREREPLVLRSKDQIHPDHNGIDSLGGEPKHQSKCHHRQKVGHGRWARQLRILKFPRIQEDREGHRDRRESETYREAHIKPVPHPRKIMPCDS